VTTAAGSTLTLVDVRRLWPDIVEATKQRRRLTWIYLTQQARVVAVDGETLTLGFANAGARDSFDQGGSAEIVRQAAIDVVGHDWRVETIVDPGADPAAAAAASTRLEQTAETDPDPPAATSTPANAPAGPQLGSSPTAEPGTAARPDRADQAPPDAADPDGGARPDDSDAEHSGLDGAQLLQEALGAQVIEEIPHS
jgi:DNA polymerase-3 subunit gamma/tau